MPLDPQAQKVLDTIAALNLKPISQCTPDEAREAMRTRTAGLGPVEEVPAVSDHHVPVTGGEITVRVYSPAGHGPHPVLVFYHGGGWVIGDLYTHDGICRSLVNAAGCAVACRSASARSIPAASSESGNGFLREMSAPINSARSKTSTLEVCTGLNPPEIAMIATRSFR